MGHGARELRDKWLEHVSIHPETLLPHGKYDVSSTLLRPDGSRAIRTAEAKAVPLLDAA
jgi:hypothetical protein